jgi:hypothetical protein
MLEPIFFAGTGLIDKILGQIQEQEKREHEKKLQELNIIADSSLRDQLAAQLLMDKFLSPIENAQHTIQNTAKHAQYLAESIGYYYSYHGMNEQEAKEICSQFRSLAMKITESNTLYELKIIYRAITIFSDNISNFKHPNEKYSIIRSIRHNILDPLNTCIASYENFQRRSELFKFDYSRQPSDLLMLEDNSNPET